jgi:hypothetical protein
MVLAYTARAVDKRSVVQYETHWRTRYTRGLARESDISLGWAYPVPTGIHYHL